MVKSFSPSEVMSRLRAILQMLDLTENVFSREHILDSVWGYDYYGDEWTVDTHIKTMRAKLDKYSHPDWKIVTVRGVGYKFNT